MALISKARPVARPRITRAGSPAASSAFEWGAAAAGGWLMTGLYLDGWAHQHFRVETFFTPWHAVLYSGMAAAAALFGLTALSNHFSGYAWRRSLPPGYGLSLLAVLGFALAGALDLAWHATFGFERSFAALISPPHLLLAGCGLVAAGGPLRSAWNRGRSVAGWPAIFAATYLLSVISFFSQFVHPFNDPYALEVGPAGTVYAAQALGEISIVFQSAVLLSVVFLLLRRHQLPPGSLLLLLTINSFAMSAMKDHYRFALVGLLAGVAGEVLLFSLRPSVSRPGSLRVFGFAWPVALYGLYFGAVGTLGGTWWSVPLWTGSIFLAGVAGLLVSYCFFSPGLRENAPDPQRP
ncbi:MAG: hypothetical protein M3Y62_06270 [Candidatus Dormibacteraeota bacterium]|nr:hypothetical protein [Candidatus Dormibacteraeota bacterium]